MRNGAGYASGQIGQAFNFDGLDDYIEVANPGNFNFGSSAPLTVETWVYRTGSGTIMHVMGKRDYCGSSFNYQMAFDPSGGLQFNSSYGGVYTGVQLAMNQWTHLAATFDGGTFRFFTSTALWRARARELGAGEQPAVDDWSFGDLRLYLSRPD